MLKTALILLVVLLPFRMMAKTDAPVTTNLAPVATMNKKLNSSALLFTENRGQVANSQGIVQPDILFTAQSGGTKIFLTATGIHYQFTKMDYPPGYDHNDRLIKDPEKQEALRRQIKMETYRFSLSLDGANLHPKVRKEIQNSYTENYYLAHCPEGITGVHTYERLVYENVYPGIDWVIYSKSNASAPSTAGMKYDFIVHPGADPSLIKLKVIDAESVLLSPEGELVMKTRLGTVTEHAPETFSAGKKVSSKFTLSGNKIGFALGDYNKEQDLRIDPSVVWATYYGGNNDDRSAACTTDANGNVYLTGYTYSANSIASGGFQNTIGGNSSDAFLVKFNTLGTRLWATYYGGNTTNEVGNSCTTDANGNVYMGGYTQSTSGIASGGFQNTLGGAEDAFLVKFNTSGVRQWATYYGGSRQDVGLSCVADASGNIYLAGHTYSTTGISSGGAQTTFGGSTDAFLVKFNSVGARLWATYYGGNGGDDANSCAVDKNDNVYIAGSTWSTSGIGFNGFQNSHGGGSSDAFLIKFDRYGTKLWGTYYGGNDFDLGSYCAVDGNNNVYLSGETKSSSGISSGGFQNAINSGQDAFLVKFDSIGTRQWATYYGGAQTDAWTSCAVNSNDDVFLMGTTNSTSGIAFGGFQNTFGGGAWDVFLIKFGSAGNREWSTYFGGNLFDGGTSCAVDISGNIFISGNTTSTININSGGFQTTYGGGIVDAFLVKIADSVTLKTIITGAVSTVLCSGQSLNIPFTSTGSFNTGNIYSAELSNAVGSFAAPVVIGTLASTANVDSIAAVIPANTPRGANYRIRVVSSSPVVVGSDNGVNITINTTPAQPGPIQGNITACTGTGQIYTIAPVDGATTYNWTLPSTWTGSSTTTTINTVAGTSGGIISVTASNSCGTSPASTLAVTSGTNIIVTPSVSIAANGSFCAGTPAIFTATPINGGNAPVYQWTKNGNNVGGNTATYTDPAPQTGDVILLSMVSNAPCAASGTVFSNAITVITTPTVVPGININTIPPSILCKGTPINFITNINGGGTTPQYKWYKNGILIPGAVSANYLDAALDNGDTLQVVLISSAACVTTPLTYSNKLGVVVHQIVAPTVTLSAVPGTQIMPGQSVTFNAVVTNGGVNPTFQWMKNNLGIPGAMGASYTTNALVNGDVIWVQVGSNAPCAITPVIVSNHLTMQIAGVGINGVKQGQAIIRLYPNPNNGRFTLSVQQDKVDGKPVEITIVNVLGQLVYHTMVRPDRKEWSVDVSVDALANSIYVLKVVSEHIEAVKQFELIR